MPSKPIDPRKVVVFTGAGISASSGIATYRDTNGVWDKCNSDEVATPDAWRRQPEMVLKHYNERKAIAMGASPTPAHHTLVELEKSFDVTIITQNVDDLHERAGSGNVIHLHGEMTKARSALDESSIRDIGTSPISLGDLCEKGGQLRPHIVWFGENMLNHAEAREHISTAAKVLVVGTSLQVEPAAGLLKHARHAARKIIVNLGVVKGPYGFQLMRGSADTLVPEIVAGWLKGMETA